MSDPGVKNLFKEEIIEVFKANPDLLDNAVKNAIEDIAMIKAIEKGDKKEYVGYDELMKVMDKKIINTNNNKNLQ